MTAGIVRYQTVMRTVKIARNAVAIKRTIPNMSNTR